MLQAIHLIIAVIIAKLEYKETLVYSRLIHQVIKLQQTLEKTHLQAAQEALVTL